VTEYQTYEPGFQYSLSQQAHYKCRGHQIHFDTRYHINPNVELKVEFEVSTDDGETWSYGGGFTVVGKEDAKNWGYAFFGHNSQDGPADENRLIRSNISVRGGQIKTRFELIGITGASSDEKLVPID